MENYLILSNDTITINDTIDKILKKHKLDKTNLIKYDASNTLLNDVIEELNTYGLFTENKVVELYSCNFLSSERKNKDLIQDESILEEYINNPNPSNILILVVEKIDERKKINKLIRKKFKIIEENINIEEKIKNNLEDYSMDNITMKYFINYLNNDNNRIMNELEKLKMYKIDDKIITKEDVNEISIKELDEDIFTLINQITKKDRKNALKIYKELTSRGEDITKIVITTIDQLRLIYKTKILINSGKNKDMITSMFKIHPYRVKLAMEASYDFSEKELQDYIIELGKIDINIKTGNIQSNTAFEIFLINL